MRTINEIMAIAGGAWQLLRMRVVYVLIICVLVLIGSAYRYDVLSLGQHKALMTDVSLMLNTLAAILVAISVTFEISRELREGVASTLLSKPLGRTHYLIGKLVGISIAGLVVTGLITLGFCVVFSASFDDGGLGQTMLLGHLLIMASVIPMSALAVLFSVIVPESISAIVTAIAIWFAHSTPVIDKIQVLYGGILPDLNLFNLKAEAAYNIPGAISWTYLLLALVWGIVYSVFSTSLASLVFNYRDLK
jgi:ABC-type transport system involved in multi-copper enzyme maturation permease subunit